MPIETIAASENSGSTKTTFGQISSAGTVMFSVIAASVKSNTMATGVAHTVANL